jgi:hypothetical protein
MTGYGHVWDFERDTARLIAEGANLRDLYEAMLTIEDDRGRVVDASAKTLRMMAETWWQSPSFVRIRLAELFGGLEVPHTDDYVLAMVGHLGGRHEQEARLHLLRHDPGLREETFWRMFEVEGGGEISLTNIDKLSREDLNWHNTVVLLANEGTIDRTRLLRSCLEALNRDFSAYRSGWFSQVYNALAPSASEAAADQALLRQCMGSSVGATVSLGVKHLLAVQQAGLLDGPEFVDTCAPALASSKTAAMGVLKILEALTTKEPVLASSATDSIAHGMAHPHPDVQRAAVKLLVKLGREDLARRSREALSPAVAIELIPERASSIEPGAMPVTAATARTPRASAPLVAWSDDDARERFAALLEFGTDAIELELAMAWLARSVNASKILEPLVKRARKIDANNGRFWIASLVLVAADPEKEYLPQEMWQRSKMLLVDGRWIEQATGKPEPLLTEEQKTVLPSLVTRLREVASILQGRSPQTQLLATPTDTSGRLDANTLLERLQHASSHLPVDLTQALLRVPSDERARVAKAAGVKNPFVTQAIAIKWHSRGSAQLKSNGLPMWTWWKPEIVAESGSEPSPTQPAFIPSSGEGLSSERGWREMSNIVASSVAFVTPDSTLPLVAVAIPVLHHVMSEVNHAAGPLLRGLASHPGPWTSETAQVLALGMAAHDAALRAEAVELFADAIPTRLEASQTAIGFAACQPAVVLNRWASSFSDAATISPDAAIDVMTHLLPKLERDTRGIGALIGVLVDESIRRRRRVENSQLRRWFEEFSGSSAAAKAAKAALSLTAD